MTDPDTDPDATDAGPVRDAATRVVVSFRSPETDADEGADWWIADSDWLAENMTEHTYRQYLRRAHAGPVALGDEWEEFVNCGCASPEDVILRVERIEGGREIGLDTAIEVVPRRDVVEGGGLDAVLDD